MNLHAFLAGTCAAALPFAVPSELLGEPLRQSLAASSVVDLTHPLHEQMPYWPGGVAFRLERLADYDDGYRFHRFEMGENVGTHVDAPSHFIAGGRSVDMLPLSDLIVPAVVIDIEVQVARDADYELSATDIEHWEAEHGSIPEGSLALLRTGWAARATDPAAYVNMDEAGVMHFPGFGPDSARLLVELGVVGVGIDTLSVDHGPSEAFESHRIMLAAGRYQIENLANLDALPPTGATVVVGVLPVRDGSQAQARVFALLP
jgi:kynurenine formamidase